MDNYIFNLPIGNTGNTFEAVVDNSSIYAGSNESYKNNIQVWIEYHAILNASQTYPVIEAYCALCDYYYPSQLYERRLAISIENIQSSGEIQVFNTPSVSSQGATFQINYSRSNPVDTIEGTEIVPFFPGTTVLSWADFRVESVGGLHISANIPIFETDAEALEYIQYGDNIEDAINVGGEKVNGRDFAITNIWTTGTWSASGYTPASGAALTHRDVRGRIVSGEICLYPVAWDGGDKLYYNVINNASFEALEYTTNGTTWISSATFPFNFFYKERTTEIGTFSYAVTNYIDRIPIFSDEETAQGYIDGDVPITDAINWDEISNDYPGEDLPIDVGDPDDGTDWGDVYTQNFFANTYLCGTGALREIANKLYDTTPQVMEDILKGLTMFGNNPIESVISLIYYPCDLSSVFTNISSTNNIWFGGYNFQNMTNSVYQVVYPNGYFYCGGVSFTPVYGSGNWKNYKACRIFVDLPYCGRYELDPAKYWGKFVKIIYYIDLTTGGCAASLINGADDGTRNGTELDRFNGVIGTKLSMTLTDFASYANAQINTLLGSGGQAISNGATMGENGASAIMSGNMLGGAGAVGGAAALGAIQGAKTVYGLTMNNINKFNQTRGGSSAMINQYANQKPTFIFIYPDTDNPSNFNKMYGTPSNAGGAISSFTGYLEADTVKLNVSGATESEKEKIRSLLMGGIYIGNRS